MCHLNLLAGEGQRRCNLNNVQYCSAQYSVLLSFHIINNNKKNNTSITRSERVRIPAIVYLYAGPPEETNEICAVCVWENRFESEISFQTSRGDLF